MCSAAARAAALKCCSNHESPILLLEKSDLFVQLNLIYLPFEINTNACKKLFYLNFFTSFVKYIMKFFEIYYEIYYEINKNNTEYFFFNIVIKLRVVKVLNIIYRYLEWLEYS